MVLTSVDILGSYVHIRDWHNSFISLSFIKMCSNVFLLVIFAKEQRSNSLSNSSFTTFTNSMSSMGNITMNFIEGLPTSNYRNNILVVVYCLKKLAYFLSLAHPFTAKTIFENFVRVVKLHGMPRTIINDQDLCLLVIFGISSSNSQELN